MKLRQHTRGTIGLSRLCSRSADGSSCRVAADEVLACNEFSEHYMDAYHNQTTGTVSYAYLRALLLHTQSCGTCQQGSGKVGQFIILYSSSSRSFTQCFQPVRALSFVSLFAPCLRAIFCRFRICVEDILLHDPTAHVACCLYPRKVHHNILKLQP
jgi:hypothetical protein